MPRTRRGIPKLSFRWLTARLPAGSMRLC